MKLEIEILPGMYAIHRMHPHEALPSQLLDGAPWFAARSERELSVVCRTDIQLDSRVTDSGWRTFRIAGTLDFDMVGVLSGLTGCLASAGIPVFVVSTFETDYFLVKQDRFESAISLLQDAGYRVRDALP